MRHLVHFFPPDQRKCAIGAFGAFPKIHFRSPEPSFFRAARFGPGAADESYSLEDLGEERVPANRWMAEDIGHVVGKIPAHAVRAWSPASHQPFKPLGSDLSWQR